MIKKIVCCALLGLIATGTCIQIPQKTAKAFGAASKLTAMPTIITEVKTRSEFDDYCQNGSSDALYFYVSDDLSIQLSSGTLTISDIAHHKNNGKINTEFLPIFHVKTQSAATKLAEYINENLIDCMVASEDAKLVKTMRGIAKKASGLLDFRDKEVLTVKEIRDSANCSFAKTVLLGANNTHEDKVQGLQKLLMTVWAYDSGDNVERYRAVSSGANGIFTADSLGLEKLINSFDEKTLIRAPLIIGHRGIPATMPENTLEGAIEAVKNGANAIESDIYLSSDNKLIISHDPRINRTTNYTGRKLISEMTLAEIKSAEIRGRKGEIFRVATLDEYLAEFKGTGVVQVIEIKDNNQDVIKYLSALIKNTKTSDQVVLISFNTAHLTKCLEIMPEISVADLNDIPVGSSPYQTAVSTMEKLNEKNFACNTNLSKLTPERAKYIQDRGIPCVGWTYSDTFGLIDAFLGSYHGLTADNAHDLAKFSSNIKVQDDLNLFSGIENDSPFITPTLGGDDITADSGQLIHLAGDNLNLGYNNGKISAENNGTGIYYYRTKFSVRGITEYWLYSKPINITVTDAPPAEKTGCGGRSMFSGAIALGCLSIIALWAFIRTKKVYFN